MKEINLSVPKSWNDVSTQDLEKLVALGIERDIMQGDMDNLATQQFKMKALLVLAGLRLKGKYIVRPYPQDNIYLFRRRSLWPWSQKVPLTGKWVAENVEKHLKWLDNPFARLRAPYDIITIRGKKFKGPSSKMTSVTYQQYTFAQNILASYWQLQDNIKSVAENNPDSKAIKVHLKKLQQVRCMFLACLFCPGTIETEIIRDGRRRKIHRVTYDFDPNQVESNWKKFRSIVDRVFPVMLLFFLSVQQYFSTIFPDLFVPNNSKNKKRPDYLMQEIETMTAIMKYQGFSDYQTIYDSNTVHILKVLDNMAKDAKEMKRQRAKLKT